MVESGGLENRCRATYRGFESLRLRKLKLLKATPFFDLLPLVDTTVKHVYDTRHEECATIYGYDDAHTLLRRIFVALTLTSSSKKETASTKAVLHLLNISYKLTYYHAHNHHQRLPRRKRRWPTVRTSFVYHTGPSVVHWGGK